MADQKLRKDWVVPPQPSRGPAESNFTLSQLANNSAGVNVGHVGNVLARIERAKPELINNCT